MNYKKRKKIVYAGLWLFCPMIALLATYLLILDANFHAYEVCLHTPIIIVLTMVIICGSFWVLKLWVEEKERQEKSEKPVDGPRMAEKDAKPYR